MTDPACNLTWMQTYVATLNMQEATMYRSQQLHFDVAGTLAELLESRYDGEGLAGYEVR
jgi:hypothetical protein